MSRLILVGSSLDHIIENPRVSCEVSQGLSNRVHVTCSSAGRVINLQAKRSTGSTHFSALKDNVHNLVM
jgi:hypothetical protein